MSGPQFIYHMHRLSKIVPPKREILKNINLSFYPGAKIGVVGTNGSGKSSLLRIMAGIDTDFLGEAWAAKGTRIGYLAQEPELDESLNVRENVELAVSETRDLLRKFEEVSLKFGEISTDEEMNTLLQEQSRLQDRIEAVGAWELDRKVEIAMDALRLPPSDAAVTMLSGGERRRVALCRVLLEQPDMLPARRADQSPGCGIGRVAGASLGRIPGNDRGHHPRPVLPGQRGAVDPGTRPRTGHSLGGQLHFLLEQKSERLRVEEKGESARQKTLERELEWVRMSPRARQAKGKARMSAYEELLDRDEREQARSAEILIPKGPRLGRTVINTSGVRKAFGDQLLVDDLSFDVPAGAIVGIVGGNGAGKTTLFRMLVGEEQPDSGTLELGQTVELAYVDQSREELDPEKSVFDEVSGGHDVLYFGRAEVNARAYLSWFAFRGADQQKKAGVLSGGERNRLHLAKLLKSGGNVLLLDEPTNDLDVDTLRALENAILDFAGCVLVISHDRWFLDRVATHILAFEGDSRAVWFEGNHTEYEDDRRRRLGESAVQPHRLKYRKLIRD